MVPVLGYRLCENRPADAPDHQIAVGTFQDDLVLHDLILSGAAHLVTATAVPGAVLAGTLEIHPAHLVALTAGAAAISFPASGDAAYPDPERPAHGPLTGVIRHPHGHFQSASNRWMPSGWDVQRGALRLPIMSPGQLDNLVQVHLPVPVSQDCPA